ncbi:MAG: hypothetical protein U0835_13200 [Isosphaeraceae bacterium]
MAAATDDASLLQGGGPLRHRLRPAIAGPPGHPDAVEPLVQRLAQAMQRRATDPARLEEYRSPS